MANWWLDLRSLSGLTNGAPIPPPFRPGSGGCPLHKELHSGAFSLHGVFLLPSAPTKRQLQECSHAFELLTQLTSSLWRISSFAEWFSLPAWPSASVSMQTQRRRNRRRTRENTGELPASVVFARGCAIRLVVIRCWSRARQLQGSGVVVGGDEVITNYHVVEVHRVTPWAADAA